MNNLLRGQIEKMEAMQERYEAERWKVRKLKNSKKNIKEMLEIKNTNRSKECLWWLISRLDAERKESVSLSIYQYKLSKFKCKEKKIIKILNKIFKNCGEITKSVTYVMRIQEDMKERNG